MNDFSKLERSLKRLLSRGPHEAEALAELLAAYVSSSSSPEEEVHIFLHHTSEVISRCLLRNPERFQVKTATIFLEESLRLIKWGPELLAMSVEDFLDDGINDIFVAIDRILGSCRYRLYTIDPKEMCYRGLKSVGMYTGYSQEFDVEQPEFFNKTKLIPFAEPPFKQLDLTSCFVLYGEDLSQIDDKSRDWYFRHLGLGNRTEGVPETYTWEFTVDGVAKSLCRFSQEPDRLSYSLAFSMDAGVSTALDYEDRKLDLWLISLLDVLWSSSFGRDLGAFIGYVTHGLSSQSNNGYRNATRVVVDRPQAITRKAPVSEIEVTWNVNPIFIGADMEPWVGAKDDEQVEDLFIQYEYLRNHKSYVIALGPSGSGKEVFLRALHNDGESTGGGPIRTVNCLVTLNGAPEDAEVAINGAERHAYTGAQVSSGPIEGFLQANDGGSVILDELLALPVDKQMRLRSVLANLQKKPPVGFTRKGGSEILVPNVRVMATGKPGDPIDGDLKRRFPEAVKIPNWYELNAQSRIAILRWHIESHLSAYGFKRVRVSRQLFKFFVGDDVVPALLESNMGFVKNCVTTLFETSTDKHTAELTLKTLAKKLETYQQTKGIVEELLRHEDEDFPEELLIGEGSGFEKTLPSKLRLGLQLAQCGDWGRCKGCINLEDMKTLYEAKKEEVWELLYFLYAAVWWREVNNVLRASEEDRPLASKGDDGDLTGAEIVERHCGKTNYQTFMAWLSEATGFTPYQFRCSTRTRYAGYLKLREFAGSISNKRRLLGLTHLMRCAIPDFASFPFWEQTIAQSATLGASDSVGGRSP